MPYPTTLPTDQLLDIAISYIRGLPVDTPKAVETLWETLGFGLSLAFPLPPMGLKGVTPMTQDEACKALESLKGGGVTPKAFNWLALVQFILEFLSQLA